MDRLVKKYADKLIAAGLASEEEDRHPLVGGLDDELVWNRDSPEIELLEDVFGGLNINSLVFIRPIEPYRTILGFLSRNAGGGVIEPKDCETRTFLHDLPVAAELSSSTVIQALKRKKCVIITPEGDEDHQGPVIIAHGTVSPEQGFVVVSSACFAGFVKFFTDYLDALQFGRVTRAYHDAFDHVAAFIRQVSADAPGLVHGPFTDEETVYSAIIQAGRKTVDLHLVDSYFGNISYCWNNTLYISQTGSSLDALEGCVDPVPLDGTTSAGVTASSELSAHLEVIERTSSRAILHGHPKFSVIMSMDCPPEEKSNCDVGVVDQCHIKCPKARFVGDVPIVTGEVGTGPTGLCHTLPPALDNSDAAIVYGHGLFTTGGNDFNAALQTMVDVERMCYDFYFEKVANLRQGHRA